MGGAISIDFTKAQKELVGNFERSETNITDAKNISIHNRTCSF